MSFYLLINVNVQAMIIQKLSWIINYGEETVSYELLKIIYIYLL